MADYYSLLSRAVANLPQPSPASARRAIYDRARKALIAQLRSLKPQLPESDIAREENALEAAVARLETEFDALSAAHQAKPAVRPPASPPESPPPTRPPTPPLATPRRAAPAAAAPVPAPPNVARA